MLNQTNSFAKKEIVDSIHLSRTSMKSQRMNIYDIENDPGHDNKLKNMEEHQKRGHLLSMERLKGKRTDQRSSSFAAKSQED